MITNRNWASAARASPTLACPLIAGRTVLDPLAVNFEPKLVARHDRPAELDAVDRGDQRDLGARVSMLAAIRMPAAWASDSTISTPGMIGMPGPVAA